METRRSGMKLLRIPSEGHCCRSVICARCRLRIDFADADGGVVSDLLASHWADDHHLPSWRDAAAEARDRLWRQDPDLLEKLAELTSGAGNAKDLVG